MRFITDNITTAEQISFPTTNSRRSHRKTFKVTLVTLHYLTAVSFQAIDYAGLLYQLTISIVASTNDTLNCLVKIDRFLVRTHRARHRVFNEGQAQQLQESICNNHFTDFE